MAVPKWVQKIGLLLTDHALCRCGSQSEFDVNVGECAMATNRGDRGLTAYIGHMGILGHTAVCAVRLMLQSHIFLASGLSQTKLTRAILPDWEEQRQRWGFSAQV